jgi:hypothetical protein
MNTPNCVRCGADLTKGLAHTMSKFNTDIICVQCKDDETQAPGYRAADETEFNACRSGNLNFHGLSPEDQKFLSERRTLRKLPC